MQIQRIDTRDFNIWSRQIAELFNESVKINFEGFPIEDNYGDNKCDDVASYLKQGTAVTYIAYDGNKLMGWIWCHAINRMGKKRLHIAEIAVSSRYRKQGIGNALLKFAEDYAKENHYEAIELLVTAKNTDAVNFYNKSQYTTERFLMKKELG